MLDVSRIDEKENTLDRKRRNIYELNVLLPLRKHFRKLAKIGNWQGLLRK